MCPTRRTLFDIHGSKIATQGVGRLRDVRAGVPDNGANSGAAALWLVALLTTN